MTARPLRVAILAGGRSGEHEVSLAGAAAALAALEAERYEGVLFGIGRDGSWSVAGEPVGLPRAIELLQGCAVAFPLVHGAPGEDGALAALCDLAAVPHAGATLRAGALAMDKWATKLMARDLGIAVAEAIVVTERNRRGVSWTRPVVVKPAGAGSSLGVSLVADPDGLDPALDLALSYDGRVLVEEVVEGREIDLGVLRRRDGSLLCAPPLEIAREGIFSYDDKYATHPDFQVPAALSPRELKELTDATLLVAEALECRGVFRVDFFLTESGPVLNEVNTMPGMSDRSQVPLMFETIGITYAALLDELITAALAR